MWLHDDHLRALEATRQHLAVGRRLLDNQRRTLAHLHSLGLDTTLASELCAALEKTVQVYRDHAAFRLREAGDPCAAEGAFLEPQDAGVDLAPQAEARRGAPSAEPAAKHLPVDAPAGASIDPQQRLQALKQMASGVVHDIGNLLFPAAFVAQQLKEREATLSESGAKAVDLIRECLDDMTALVGRLRDFAKARAVSAPLQPVDLGLVIGQVSRLMRAHCEELRSRGIDVEVIALAKGPVPPVAGSATQIREAMVNLVLNALVAMPAGGTIRLRVRELERPATDRRPPDIEVAVEDDGVGMDDETRERCTEPFFTTKGERGTGMGLAMVQEMARQHGADLSIATALGQGTTVTIRFPAPPASLEQAAPGDAGLPVKPPGRRASRLLVVDDDALVLETLESLLQARGDAVTTAHGGRAGIEAFRQALATDAPFDVVMSDLSMPDVDGQQVAAAVKRLAPATPVVALTGWASGLRWHPAQWPGIDAVLGKPPANADLDALFSEIGASRDETARPPEAAHARP